MPIPLSTSYDFYHKGLKQLLILHVWVYACMCVCACVTTKVFSSLYVCFWLCDCVIFATPFVFVFPIKMSICQHSAEGNATAVGCHGIVDRRAVLMVPS